MFTPEMLQWAVGAAIFLGGIAVRHFWPAVPTPKVPAPGPLPPIPALAGHPVASHALLAMMAEIRGDQATAGAELLAAMQAAGEKLSSLPALPAPVAPKT